MIMVTMMMMLMRMVMMAMMMKMMIMAIVTMMISMMKMDFRAVTGRKAWVAPVCLSLLPRAQFAPFTEDDQLQVLSL